MEKKLGPGGKTAPTIFFLRRSMCKVRAEKIHEP
jgi:hypothetical protein